MTKYISIERENVRLNREHLEGCVDCPKSEHLLPVVYIELTDRSGEIAEAFVAHEALIWGMSRVVYRPHNFEQGDPNAHAWVETEGPVSIVTAYGGPYTKEIV